jgi:hypothetical protein
MEVYPQEITRALLNLDFQRLLRCDQSQEGNGRRGVRARAQRGPTQTFGDVRPCASVGGEADIQRKGSDRRS